MQYTHATMQQCSTNASMVGILNTQDRKHETNASRPDRYISAISTKATILLVGATARHTPGRRRLMIDAGKPNPQTLRIQQRR